MPQIFVNDTEHNERILKFRSSSVCSYIECIIYEFSKQNCCIFLQNQYFLLFICSQRASDYWSKTFHLVLMPHKVTPRISWWMPNRSFLKYKQKNKWCWKIFLYHTKNIHAYMVTIQDTRVLFFVKDCDFSLTKVRHYSNHHHCHQTGRK